MSVCSCVRMSMCVLKHACEPCVHVCAAHTFLMYLCVCAVRVCVPMSTSKCICLCVRCLCMHGLVHVCVHIHVCVHMCVSSLLEHWVTSGPRSAGGRGSRKPPKALDIRGVGLQHGLSTSNPKARGLSSWIFLMSQKCQHGT